MYKQAFDVDLDGSNILTMGLIKPTYQIIFPKRNGNFSNQWDSCLEQIKSISNNNDKAVTRVNIFV
nr:hypothetical protein [Prolixibacteraceae bacterium]